MDQTAVMPEAHPDPEPAPLRRGRTGGKPMTVVLVLATVGLIGWISLPVLGWDGNRYTAALVALTPYAVPCGLVLLLVTLLARHWKSSVVVGLVTIALALSMLPRVIPNEAAAGGTQLRVLSINLHTGDGDAREVLDLVREHDVDILSIQEMDAAAVRQLDRAGLSELLPHRLFQQAPGGAGTGIAARFPLRELSLVPRTTLNQPSARVDLPGDRDIEFVAVHPMFPVGRDTTATWRDELAVLPGPAGTATPRVLAGDFNATLDHSGLRELLSRGYRDAAERTGKGLQPTWPGPGVHVPPPVTIDHVLVSGRVKVQDFHTFGIAGADHRAILARLTVPG